MVNKYERYSGLEKHFQESAMSYLNMLGYLCAHTPNEVKGSAQFHLKRKREGLKKGFPDISVLEPSKGYHGLFIELKTKYNKPSSDQKKWIIDLNKKGYYACWTNSFDEFLDLIHFYFNENKELNKTMFKTFSDEN